MFLSLLPTKQCKFIGELHIDQDVRCLARVGHRDERVHRCRPRDQAHPLQRVVPTVDLARLTFSDVADVLVIQEHLDGMRVMRVIGLGNKRHLHWQRRGLIVLNGLLVAIAYAHHNRLHVDVIRAQRMVVVCIATLAEGSLG